MPIILEAGPPSDPSDISDLNRICAENAPSQPAWQSVLQSLPANAEVFTGRFNGRIMAYAVLQHEADAHSARITDLKVLSLNRRRGIARQMLQLLIKRLASSTQSLLVDLSKHPELEPLFSGLEFKGPLNAMARDLA